MKCQTNLKLVLLSLLIVNLVIRSVQAYSFVRNFSNEKTIDDMIADLNIPSVDNSLIESQPVNPEPPRRQPVYSSNVAMVWHIPESGTLGVHLIDSKSFDKLIAQAQTMTSEEVRLLTEEAQNMSTEEFVALLNTPNFKEQVEYRMMLAKGRKLN